MTGDSKKNWAISILGFALLFGCATRLPTPENTHSNRSSDLIEVPASVAAGFHFPYLLVLPRDASTPSLPFLLVEPNNTGAVADDLEVHRDAAIKTARDSSVGNFVAKHLNVPLLVPIFPRPKSAWQTYTHALDRDALVIRDGPLKRLDLQLIAMIDDARARLEGMGMVVDRQVLLNGFSASGTFVNRFALLHPDRVRGVACGGINGVLTLPLASSGGIGLPYPVGVQDLAELAGTTFSFETWKRVLQFVYMGADDNNDAVAFDDGYSPEERRIIHDVLGAKMQPDRWVAVQDVYRASGANVRFRTYPGVGHGTNRSINEEVGEFFRSVATAD